MVSNMLCNLALLDRNRLMSIGREAVDPLVEAHELSCLLLSEILVRRFFFSARLCLILSSWYKFLALDCVRKVHEVVVVVFFDASERTLLVLLVF